MKRVPKWQFSTLMDYSIIFIQIRPKFPLYTKWAEIKPILETSTIYVPKMEICKWNRSFCNFTQINPKFSLILKKANLKLAKWVKLKSTSLKSRKWMFLFFVPTIVAKTNVTSAIPYSLHSMLVDERLTQR